MAKTKRRSVKRSTMGTLQKPLFAGVTYAIGKPIVNQLLGKLNIGIQDELTEMLVAVVAKSAFKNKIVHNFADAAIIVNTASLAGQYAGNLLGGSTASTTTPAASGTMIG